MGEPISFLSATAASTSAIIKIISSGFAYAEVPDDVRAFQNSIESFSGTLNSTKRLRRVKSHLLDEKEKHDIDRNIQRASEILDGISKAIEACRKDLDTKGTISVRNRILWLVRDHQTFTSRTHTLSISHQSLNCDLSALRQLQGSPLPPSYDDLDFERSLRPPSRRSMIPSSKQPDMAEFPFGETLAPQNPNFSRHLQHEHDSRITLEEIPPSDALKNRRVSEGYENVTMGEQLTNVFSAPGRIEDTTTDSAPYGSRTDSLYRSPRRTRRSFMIT